MSDPLLSYGDLVWIVGPLISPEAQLKPNDPRLYEALAEINRACLNHNPALPLLTSIVVQRQKDGTLGIPGKGHFAEFYPQARDETTQRNVWKRQLALVRACDYPEELDASGNLAKPGPANRSWLREPTIVAAIIGLLGTLITVLATVWVSRHESSPAQLQPPQQASPDSRKVDEARQDVQKAESAANKLGQSLTLDEILAVLEGHHQRATFGAVAGLLGRESKSLFDGYERKPRTAWVVSKSTGLPTGTKKESYPSALLEKPQVIDTTEELRAWLRDHR
jgi:hypothetical protein